MNFVKKYIQQVIQELKKVSWPSKQQTINKTVLVIIVSTVAAIYIGGLDMLLRRIISALI